MAFLGAIGYILSVMILIVITAESGSKYLYFEPWENVLITCLMLLYIALNASLWYGLIREREGYLVPTLVFMVSSFYISFSEMFIRVSFQMNSTNSRKLNSLNHYYIGHSFIYL